MDAGLIKGKIISQLSILAVKKGFVTFDEVIKVTDSYDLPIDEVERVCEQVMSEGIILREENETDGALTVEVTQPTFDKTKLNYDAIYNRVITVDKSLTNYVRRLKNIVPPQYKEEFNLIYHAKEGNPYARERLISMYLKVALRIALWHHEKFGFNLDETLQDANIGLLLALDKIPLEKNNRYSTYAPWWIRQYIGRKSQSICKMFYTVPVHVNEKLIPILIIKRKHECTGCSGDKYCHLLIEQVCVELSLNKDDAISSLNLLSEPLSVEYLSDIEDFTLSDDGQSIERVIEKLGREALKEQVKEVLAMLKDKEQKVLELRYGLVDSNPKTLEEVGAIFGVTRERIRQIESKAFEKIRKLDSAKKLMFEV
ncbi:sigma-70 family RNA polymerase sigma factor [Paenibacillus lemnae]|uniref:Sigma-70 family RNA polymerase sigma factor n=1 Tax=Paenibacillus lemnae TaxID=1330551 RepID=A0A848M223_PAELE|nr:sigma-70 family RNA polymerase sigma factor [Paenibacillus lemnae]NMO94927.1 sigma-70 family RNA polymerase sigma factor [Paenibacillus lemnae]